MTIIINLKKDSLKDKFLKFLNRFNKNEIEYRFDNHKKENSIDFSKYKIEAFNSIDGLEYQKKIRDEW